MSVRKLVLRCHFPAKSFGLIWEGTEKRKRMWHKKWIQHFWLSSTFLNTLLLSVSLNDSQCHDNLKICYRVFNDFFKKAYSLIFLGGGRNIEFHYYDWQLFSERQKCLLSWSLLQHHNVKNVFWVDHYYNITTSKMSF